MFVILIVLPVPMIARVTSIVQAGVIVPGA